MKRILLAVIASGIAMCSFAQEDTTGKQSKADTIKIGGMIIIKNGNAEGDEEKKGINSINISNGQKKKGAVSTNWWIVDLGFANYNDNTNYTSADAQAFAPGFSKDPLKLRTGKSINVNVWVFMQKINMIRDVVNLKYGLGVELNNYRFDDERVRFQKNPTRIILDPTWENLDKNKLAADYVTVPLMLNFNFTPNRKRGFGFSAGVSGGYLYSARQKIKEDDDKVKTKDDFDLERFKLSYIGELSLGIVRFYGSYAPKSMWEKGLDQKPFNIGIRLSNW
jgi:hypothetical protein